MDGDDAFVRDIEPFRREMLAHCYRMLGSVDDAEEVVQETYLRAWRSYDAFEGRSSVRTWLYRIATNVCLTALERSGRRVLPSGLGGPEPDPQAAPEQAEPGVRWLQPIPDPLVAPDGADPAAVVAAREGLRLALIASLQYLPGTQRAVLTLRDVLGFPATEVAGMLGLSVAAVKSSLQRARGRLRELSLSSDDVTEPPSPHARAVLDQYIAAFQDADATELQRLLQHDAQMEATPFRNWFEGSKTCVPFLRTWVLGAPGDWRMLPTSANGQPAAVGYRRAADGARHAYGVVVLTVTGTGISRIVSFGDPALAPLFGFPATLPADRLTAEPPTDGVTAATNPLLELYVRTGGTAEGRAEAVRRYAFAVPDPTALDAIQAWAPNGVVEIGAGTGYWAASLAIRGVDVVAYDPAPAPTGGSQWFRSGEEWFPVRQSDHRAVDAHSDRCLLLVWPTKNEDWPGDAVERFHEAGGQRIVFVGEGPGGRTGDDRFHAMTGQLDRCNQCTYGLVDAPCVCEVTQLYTVEHRISIPTWEGFTDELLLLQRRTRTPKPRRRRRWRRL